MLTIWGRCQVRRTRGRLGRVSIAFDGFGRVPGTLELGRVSLELVQRDLAAGQEQMG